MQSLHVGHLPRVQLELLPFLTHILIFFFIVVGYPISGEIVQGDLIFRAEAPIISGTLKLILNFKNILKE